MNQTEKFFADLIQNKRKFIETLMVVEDKQRRRLPFKYNRIQADADATQTGMDVWVKPSSVGFSTERINNRLVDTLTCPGTNTVLVAYEDFITQRLLSKVNFSYGHLESLHIPGFPEIHHDSDFQKTFRFYDENRSMLGTSSIYIASARSKTAGRAEVIHHLLLDEHAFYPPEATERILVPAMARVPVGGTVDSFSTPNGEDNEFHEWYAKAKEGKSIFTPHFYPWYLHEEYQIKLGDVRIKDILETNQIEFDLDDEEKVLHGNKSLTFDQIRWRRWMSKLMESLRRSGEKRTLFKQEFPEDDVSCFLATGDMYFDVDNMDKLARECYPAPIHKEHLNVWYPPERGKKYQVNIDPGQAKITETSINVMAWKKDKDNNDVPIWCARDSGLYAPELTVSKAIIISNYYNRATISWEANSHGLAISALLKNRRPIYFRKDVVSGKTILTPGWLTTPGNKEYMLGKVAAYLDRLDCKDIELVRQLRNIRTNGDVGLTDILMSLAIGLCTSEPNPIKRGLIGQAGWRW